MWWLAVVAGALITLAHTAPFPFILEYLGPGRSVWHRPSDDDTPVVYLTYDDGPNPEVTPALLDVLDREGVTATFFVIPRHVTEETAHILRRAISNGHAVALHSHTRGLLLKTRDELHALLDAHADDIERLSGHRPCSLFRPHAGWRGGELYAGLDRAGYTLAGWSFAMWDWNWWRPARPDHLAERLADRASDGDIVVMHDGHHVNPRAERQRTVTATAGLIPRLKVRGFRFGNLCNSVSGFERTETESPRVVGRDLEPEGRAKNAEP